MNRIIIAPKYLNKPGIPTPVPLLRALLYIVDRDIFIQVGGTKAYRRKIFHRRRRSVHKIRIIAL